MCASVTSAASRQRHKPAAERVVVDDQVADTDRAQRSDRGAETIRLVQRRLTARQKIEQRRHVAALAVDDAMPVSKGQGANRLIPFYRILASQSVPEPG